MAGSFILGFFAAIILGVVLTSLGLRGRRINRNPTCRSCGFDLSGILPDGVTCPECGAGLKRDKAVRMGQRRRMWIVAAVGILLIVLPVGGLATTVYAVLTGADVNQYKPVGFLLWEARHTTNPANAEAIAKEFSRRRQADRLDEAQALRVVETALEIQADLSKPWCEEWGDFIEMSRTDGITTKEHYKRFAEHSLGVECATRPTVAAGNPLPIAFTQTDARVGAGSTFSVTGYLMSARLDGEEIPHRIGFNGLGSTTVFDGSGEIQFDADWPVMQGFAAGSSSQWGNAWVGADTVLLRLPEDIAPGPHRLELEIRIQAQEIQMNTTSWGRPPGEGDSAAHTLRADFEVIADAASEIEVIPPSEKAAGEIRDALSPVRGWVWEQGFGGRQMNLSMNPGGVPYDLAFEVFLVRDNKQLRLGPLVHHVDTSATNAWGSMGVGGPGLNLNADLGKTSVAGAKLVLRPKPELALRTTNITRVYGGEVVITELEIQNDEGTILTDEQLAVDEPAETEEDRQLEESGAAFGRWLRGLLSGG